MTGLPSDQRLRQGGALFLACLLMFFLASLLLYAIYAFSRRDDTLTSEPLPLSLLISTVALVVVSGLLHAATRTVRRERRRATATLLMTGMAVATLFMWVQFVAMADMLQSPATKQGLARGVVGMVAVLAFLHALHVAGGIIGLAFVTVRAIRGRYDHERHWPVDFTAQYWHFLDVVWLCMLGAFWATTGGFSL